MGPNRHLSSTQGQVRPFAVALLMCRPVPGWQTPLTWSFSVESVCPRHAIALLHGLAKTQTSGVDGAFSKSMFIELACCMSDRTLSYLPVTQPMAFVVMCAERRNELHLPLHWRFHGPRWSSESSLSGPRPVSRPPTTSEVGGV